MNTFSYANTSANYQSDRYIHPCPHCPLMFASPHNVEQHCREQHNYTGVQCPECLREFSRNWLMYRHMNQRHGINIHPGQGRQRPGAIRRRRSRRAVGRRGPVATRPQASQIPQTTRSLQVYQVSAAFQAPQAPEAVAEPFIILGWDNEEHQEVATRALQAPPVFREPYIILGWDDEKHQEDADFGTPAFDQVMGAEQAIVTPAHDQTIAEPYISLRRGVEQREGAELGIKAFDHVMDAEQAFEATAYDQTFDPTPSTYHLFCPDQNCPAVFTNQEHLLGHLHSARGMPYSANCECIECFLKQIAGDFLQAGGKAQFSDMAALFQTTTPVSGLETYASGNETDAENDSGIDNNSPSIDQPFSHSNKPSDQPTVRHDATTASDDPGRWQAIQDSVSWRPAK